VVTETLPELFERLSRTIDAGAAMDEHGLGSATYACTMRSSAVGIERRQSMIADRNVRDLEAVLAVVRKKVCAEVDVALQISAGAGPPDYVVRERVAGACCSTPLHRDLPA